ncbi:MAG TPA: ADP-ribosylglycohydrolase family protein [Deltaproteobacteria bacterium]|nr:ADP-ribosylglycohydrolase family protein [Deltaproteobacteria bacterium]HOI06075.1 ADP-ribosylglycohydrolase family protein [Deltaproteobacteria bacterium]
MRLPERSQYVGSLVGQCLGDALGFPVEGQPHSVCREYVQEIIEEGPGLRARPGYVFGQYTDDSQLARELILSCLSSKGFNPADYAVRIADLFSMGRMVGGGIATWDAAMRLSQGVPWDQAGEPSPSAGNGSAMRAGPIGLMYFDRTGSLVKAAHDQSFITHKDIRCSVGSVAIAGSVALALVNRPIDKPQFIAEISHLVSVIDPSAEAVFASLINWIDLKPVDAIRSILSEGYAFGDWQDWQGLTPFVTGTVLWSLYSFLRTPDNYLETMATAIEVGGDVDSTAAMAGAISGAYLGMENLPEDLASHLTDQETWGFGELRELALDLFEMKVTRNLIPDYP